MIDPALTPARKDMKLGELIVLLAMLMALQAAAIDAMLPALPALAVDLGVEEANRRQLVVGLFLVASGLGSLIPGALADRFGRRPVLLTGLAGYTLFALGCALASDFSQLLVMRVLQGLCSSAVIVVPTSIIRDRYEGDRMARLMSTIFAVFITVPIIAPSLGLAILAAAGWRAIFLVLAGWGGVVALWFFLRMPETLPAQRRQPLAPGTYVANMRRALCLRASVGYVFAGSLVTAGIFGYVNSAEQLVGEHFGAGHHFALIFGATAATMIISNLTNARIVERFGARRVSHMGLVIFILLSAAQIWFALGEWQSLAWFVPLLAANMAVIGFLTANFSSIAMQPFGEIAGAASSAHTFVRMFGAGVMGIVIGQAYDGTSRPLAYALLIIGLLALALVLFSEQGRLFQRRNPPRPPASLP